MLPPPIAIGAAIEAAQKSPCAKSKRGVAAFARLGDGPKVFGTGFNGPPGAFTCDGSAACRRDCAKRCVHAEVRAMRNVALLSATATQLDLLHVEVGSDGILTASIDGPSCWQCSREILDAGIRGIWLYERRDELVGFVGEWRYYVSDEFHRLTLTACGVYQP